MTSSHDLRQLSRQARERIDHVDRLRAEQRLIHAQTAQRLRRANNPPPVRDPAAGEKTCCGARTASPPPASSRRFPS